jgi:hypothetical protein
MGAAEAPAPEGGDALVDEEDEWNAGAAARLLADQRRLGIGAVDAIRVGDVLEVGAADHGKPGVPRAELAEVGGAVGGIEVGVEGNAVDGGDALATARGLTQACRSRRKSISATAESSAASSKVFTVHPRQGQCSDL